MAFIHLHTHSYFSFLDGASSPQELVERAADLGMKALALTDHNNLCGAVEFHRQATRAGIKPLQGVEVNLEGGWHLVLLAQNPSGYSNLCRILTSAHLGNPRGKPEVAFDLLEKYSKDLIALSGCRRGQVSYLLLRKKYLQAREAAKRLINIFGKNNFFLELQQTFLPGDRTLNRYLVQLAENLGVKVVATNNVHYVYKKDFKIHDLLTCIRNLTRLEDIHPERPLNGENYLKSAQEMQEIFIEYPQALRAAQELAEECQPALTLDNNLFPRYPLPPGETAEKFLKRLTFQGAVERYGKITPAIAERLNYELKIIFELGFADYFLLVWDLVRYARQKGIRYAGRGSAADSAVAYCLYITEVDAIRRQLLFERFMSLERGQKPDIDIDFDSRHRDQVARYLSEKYGDEHVAAVCTYNTYQARSALRDLGKVMNFPEEEIDALAKKMPHIPADEISHALEKLPELQDACWRKPRYQKLFDYCRALAGFPRFIGTHLGGIVISREPLVNITPLQKSAKGVVVTQFDKKYVEELGLVKLDLLSLKTLTAIEDTMRNLSLSGWPLDYESIPYDDKKTFAMINQGNTVGVFQLESPAQRALQCRLKASRLEDLVASVALIRPGPIKGNMVEPFIARRKGEEPVSYLHPKLKPILEKTYGVVLFQEQVIEIATAIAGFTPGEADELRRVMSHARSHREMEAIGKQFIQKAIARGIDSKTAETIFSCIKGYASYGFCEAHAAAFASLAYKTAYLACHYPVEFFAALLSNQPMGYYPANTLCQEARRRGIKILPPDINRSQAQFSVEGNGIRVSLSQIKQMTKSVLNAILKAREQAPFSSLDDFRRRVFVPRPILQNLILCGAFDTLHPNRRQLLWKITGEKNVKNIPDFTPEQKQELQYRILGIDIEEHYMARWRPLLQQKGYKNTRELRQFPDRTCIKVAGIVIAPHRPPTRSGRTVVFFSLEDEFGLADVTVFEDVYQIYGNIIFSHPSPPLAVTGILQRRGNGINIIAREVKNMYEELKAK
ncbi:DNA polymerase III subunit alpha [Calderihabitans maritimus]|uniref:DNA-directed DNA polymerase n=1 Tax=Calderihabitans maritimus TaxID=1246530 RepID=A0A1Z5HX23_9FIRM|nr:DNA polymerase III subunit alpha [Calderihabitans maritimus]GAW93881.1 DNA polymerase III subunit alpha [Calderihabitans maritimus]